MDRKPSSTYIKPVLCAWTGFLCMFVTYPVAKDTGRWQAAKNLALMPNVSVGLVVRTTEKSVTRGWEYY